MAVVPAWDFPGADGDYAYLPALGLTNGMRTGAGFPARTIIIVASLDTVAPGADMALFIAKRASNDGINHGMTFDDGNNRLEYTYNTSIQTGTANSSIAATTWYAFCYCDAGNGGNITVRVIPLSTATQTSSAAVASGGSAFDDGQTQQIDLGGYESGGVVNQELNGQIALVLVLDSVALSQSECESFADDPLNYGDTLVQTYGADSWFWDDSGTDVGPNNVGQPTLAGSVTRQSSGGPDIPERTPPTAELSPTITSVGDFGIIYSGEERVLITGLNFGATAIPLVGLTTDPDGGGQVLQDVNWSNDTNVNFNCDRGSLSPGQMYVFVTNQEVGDYFDTRDSQSIEVRADPGVEVIAVRQTPAPTNLQTATPVSLAMGDYFYKRDAQEELTYSVTGLPTGLSLDTDTGVISGTLTALGTFSPEITAMDPNGGLATQSFSWEVAEAPVVTPGGGSPSGFFGRSRRASRRSF